MDSLVDAEGRDGEESDSTKEDCLKGRELDTEEWDTCVLKDVGCFERPGVRLESEVD